MELSVENPNIKPLQLTDTQWSFISGLLRITDAQFVNCGIIRPDEFAEARRQLLYANNSSLMSHFAKLSLTEPNIVINSVLDFITTCDKLNLPIFWGNQHEVINHKMQLDAGTYVVGDLHGIVNVSVCDSLLTTPTVLVCDDSWIYSYPIPTGRYVFFDNKDGVYSVTSSLAIAPKVIAKENHNGKEFVVGQTSLFYDRGIVYFGDLSFNLLPYGGVENLCE